MHRHSTVAVIELTISRESWQTCDVKLSSEVASAAICTREGPIDFPKGLVFANLMTPCMYLAINVSLGGCFFSVQGDLKFSTLRLKRGQSLTKRLQQTQEAEVYLHMIESRSA